MSDLFSIASIAYEMISSELPFNIIKSNRDQPTTFSRWKYKRIKSGSKDRKDLPEWIDNVLKKGLAAKPENRYQAMSEFQKDLRKPSQEMLTSSEYVPLIERNPLRFWQGISAILVLVIICQWVTLFNT